MDKNNAETTELRTLLAKAFDGQVSQEEVDRINFLLKNNEELMEFYLDFTNVNFGLSELKEYEDVKELGKQYSSVSAKEFWADLARFEGELPAIENEEPVEERPKVVRKELVSHKLKLRLFLGSIAALLIMVVHFWFTSMMAPVAIGNVNEVINPEWSQSCNGYDAGNAILTKTPIKLEGGLAKLILDNGTSIVLEGGSSVLFESSSSMFLRYGKVFVTAGKLESGEFTVRTEKCDIVDFGTEFGVSVDNAGMVETHVLSGVVEMQSREKDAVLKLEKGQAAIGGARGGGIQRTKFDRLAFISNDEFDAIDGARDGSEQDRWKVCHYKILRYPALAACYFCGQEGIGSGNLVNTAPLTEGSLDGVFGDSVMGEPVWGPGRWPGNEAAYFKRENGRVIVIPDAEELNIVNPVTISLWLYIPDGDVYGGHIISCRNEQNVYFQFSIFDGHYPYKEQRNCFEFLQYGGASKVPGAYSSVVPLKGAWNHMAAVYDGKFVTFYLNGSVSDFQEFSGDVDASVAADIHIGAAKTGEGKYPIPEGNLEGAIDELMIFKRCLDSTEIQEMYEAGKS